MPKGEVAGGQKTKPPVKTVILLKNLQQWKEEVLERQACGQKIDVLPGKIPSLSLHLSPGTSPDGSQVVSYLNKLDRRLGFLQVSAEAQHLYVPRFERFSLGHTF